MKKTPLISVIIPIYKVEALLERCVDSVLAQTYRNLEVILVDDGSPDRCGEICDAYVQKDPRISVIHKENGGLSSARNAGLDIAEGEYIAFLDSDDWLEPETYETMLALAEKNGVKLVCAGRYDVYGEEKILGLCPEREETVSGETFAGMIFRWDHCDSAAWDKLYHRSLWESARYPLGKINEDVPVTYRLALAAGEVTLCPKPFVNYYHRPGSITTASVSDKSFHFAEHTEAIYSYILENYPAIADHARYLRVKALSHMLLLLDTSEAGTREKYKSRYTALRSQLTEHTGFVCRCPWFGKKEKITDLLLILGLYRILRPIFTKEAKK